MSIGKNIKRLRSEAELTQKEMALLLDVPQPQISDWENDRYAILGTHTLLKIAKGMGCSLDELLAGVDDAYDRDRSRQTTSAARIPVIGEGNAPPNPQNEDAEQFTEQHAFLVPLDAYAVRLDGNAMLPAHAPESVVIVAPSLHPVDGDEVYTHALGRVPAQAHAHREPRLHTAIAQPGVPLTIREDDRCTDDARRAVLPAAEPLKARDARRTARQAQHRRP